MPTTTRYITSYIIFINSTAMINAQGLYTLTLKTSTASYEIYQGASLRAAKSRNDSPAFYVDISPRMTSMAVYKSYSMKQLAFVRYRASFEITIRMS